MSFAGMSRNYFPFSHNAKPVLNIGKFFCGVVMI